ncbi:hypothetical protein FA95DRAFT_209666 [Auriscalpium vulgare]|uniref:Uncharacterized protein n=1 Tax=Auriscalpium vulgare TaxID=40419 RepID=A0ACB8RMG0_9AGAM|nr:hypothetical protein FA95DRAFT_209666 [Auriscalpium vulgare]
MVFDRRRSGVPIDEFKALVSATFDNIGRSPLHLDSRRDFLPIEPPISPVDSIFELDEGSLEDDATPRQARPYSGGTRHSALSFFRKVKTHATSIVHGNPTSATHDPYGVLSDKAPTSFLPHHARSDTPAGRSRSKSLPRTLLAFGLIASPLDRPPPLPQAPRTAETVSAPVLRSFFDHGDTDEDATPPATTRVNTRPAMRRLSSIFDAPLDAPALAKPPSISSNGSTGSARPESGATASSNSKGAPKLSLTTKLRTKISRSRLSPFGSSHTITPYTYTPGPDSLPTPSMSYSPYSDGPSPVTPASCSFPRAHSSPAYEDARKYEALRQGRAFTPEEDPFRKGALVYAGENAWTYVPVSPQRRSFQVAAKDEKRRQLQKSRSTPKLSSRWSTDSDSPPSSPIWTTSSFVNPPSARDSYRLSEQAMPIPVVTADAISPLSFTFPLPPGGQNGNGGEVTVRVSTPLPGPPPSYPLPSIPAPARPLPLTPPDSPASNVRSSQRSRRDSAQSRKAVGKTLSKPPASLDRQRRRSRMDRSSRGDSSSEASRAPRTRRGGLVLASSATPDVSPQWLADCEMSSAETTPEGAFDRICSGTNCLVDEIFELCDPESVGLEFTNPWTDETLVAEDDAVPDSDVEPDWPFESFNPRKKSSVASSSSIDSTASASTATSSTTILTAATTVSPSNSPAIDLSGTLELFHKPSVPRVFVTDDYEDRQDRIETFYSARSRPVSRSEADLAAHAAGLYTLQADHLSRDTVPRGIFLSHMETVTLGACGWSELRRLSEEHGGVVPIRMLTEADAELDVEVVEILRDGRTCGVEVVLHAWSRSPCSSAASDTDTDDFHVGIPGSYPGYPARSRDDALVPRRLSLSIPGPLADGVLAHIPAISPISFPHSALSPAPADWRPPAPSSPVPVPARGALGLEGVPPLCDVGSISPPTPESPAAALYEEDEDDDDDDSRMRVLAFRMTLPTTLRDLVRCAGARSLCEGVAAAEGWF